MYQNFGKRVLDGFISSGLLFLLLPAFFLLWLILLISTKGSPFFFQPRPGKNGKIFQIIKFKTMGEPLDAQGNEKSDAQRLTRSGKWIRKTSLDELPQLINVIKGDMSLVGPRPLLVEYMPLYNSHQNKRHNVRPGITGLAQINGRNGISWEKRFEYDVWYTEHVSLGTDVKILLHTFKVFGGKGISENGHVTMSKFTGTGSQKSFINKPKETMEHEG
jgi:lipopolysaccharide/colanic/teichoic acid biosynthesis glycosyltransferase